MFKPTTAKSAKPKPPKKGKKKPSPEQLLDQLEHGDAPPEDPPEGAPGPEEILDRLRAAGARDLDVGEVYRVEEP